MKTNVMLDIETYGNAPGSVIKSIGAVKFGGGKILSRFYHRIDTQSCVDAGLTMDAATVDWWLIQSDEARAQIVKPGEPLRDVLLQLQEWIADPEVNVWGNGAAYDNVLVASAYQAAVGVLPKWAHRHSLCYRTIKNANRDLPIDPYRIGKHHNALDDAESQALHLMAIWARDAKRAKALEHLASGLVGLQCLVSMSEAKPPQENVILIGWPLWLETARAIVLD